MRLVGDELQLSRHEVRRLAGGEKLS